MFARRSRRGATQRACGIGSRSPSRFEQPSFRGSVLGTAGSARQHRTFCRFRADNRIHADRVAARRHLRAVPGKKIDFDTVREIALALPEVEESTIHGAPSMKVRGKLLTCPALHSSAEPNTLMVRIDFDRRAELMEAEPDVYYLTNHYVNHPSVLVRLSRIDRTALKDLLDYAWRFVSSGTKASKQLG